MSRLDELARKLSVAAAAEGKSVTVVYHPLSVDVEGKNKEVNTFALSSAMIAMAASCSSPFGGALSMPPAAPEIKVDERV